MAEAPAAGEVALDACVEGFSWLRVRRLDRSADGGPCIGTSVGTTSDSALVEVTRVGILWLSEGRRDESAGAPNFDRSKAVNGESCCELRLPGSTTCNALRELARLACGGAVSLNDAKTALLPGAGD